MQADASPDRGLTVPELARLLRVSPDKIRFWVRSGELPAINTSGSRCARPRFVILPHHLVEFEKSRGAAAPPRPARRRRRQRATDYYPETS
jgi:excisionase family DNA binding protein